CDVLAAPLEGFAVSKRRVRKTCIGKGVAIGNEVPLGRSDLRLRRLQHDRGVAAQPLRVGVDLLDEHPVFVDRIEQSQAKCFRGGHPPAAENEVRGCGRADLANQPGNAAPGKWYSEIGFRQEEVRTLAGKSEVAREHQDDSTSDTASLNRGDRDRTHPSDGFDHLPTRVDDLTHVLGNGRPGELLQIKARTEGYPFSRNDDNLYLPLPVEPPGSFDEFIDQRSVE